MECFLVDRRQCHVAQFFEVNNLSETQRRLLHKRSEVLPPDGFLIYYGHHKNLLLVYSTFYKSCSEPYGPHKKPITEGLRIVTLQEHDKYFNFLEKRVIPGRKLCTNCIRKLNYELREYEKRVTEESSHSSESQEVAGNSLAAPNSQTFLTPEDTTAENFDTFLRSLSLKPIKRSSHHNTLASKISYAKKNLHPLLQ